MLGHWERCFFFLHPLEKKLTAGEMMGFFQEESRCSRYFQVQNMLAFGGRLLGWCFETNVFFFFFGGK